MIVEMVPADKLEYFRLRGYKFLFCHSVEPLFYLHLVHGSSVSKSGFSFCIAPNLFTNHLIVLAHLCPDFLCYNR